MQKYSTIVLFAARQGRKVINGATFTALVQVIMDSLWFKGRKLTSKGTVYGRGHKSIAPRGGPWSANKLAGWGVAVDEGTLLDFRLSQPSPANGEKDPLFFVYLTNYGNDGASESDVDDDGYFFPPFSLTIAIPSEAVSGHQREWDGLCLKLAIQMKAIFGFMESSRLWGIPSGYGGIGELMDVRGHDVPNLEYGSGERGRMDAWISRLRSRCILRKTHLRCDLDQLRGQAFVDYITEGRNGIIMVAFKNDPEMNPAIAAQAAQFFNILPLEIGKKNH